jgi:sulfur dioxygenase
MVSFGTSSSKDESRELASSYVAGLVFAAGLVLAGMGQRSKVVGFLNLSPSPAGWDPSLMLVLGGAVGLCFCGFRLIAHCMERPRLGRKFCLPPTDRIDLPLILGGWCFGLGWGVAGICPGPGLLLVASGYPKALLGFAPALAVGMHLAVAVKLRIKAANSKAADISASAPPSAAPLFRQLIDKESSTYSYLLADPESRDAVLIDPVLEQQPRDEKLLRELGLRLRYVINTHVHADHFSGSGLLKSLFADDACQSVLGANSGEHVKADIKLGDGERIAFGRFGLTAASTPGHTDGCITLVLDDQTMAFTGDALLVRGCGRTDFQGGSAPKLYVSVRRAIFSLPDTCLLYPAHDYKGFTATTVGEEKALNPRLAEGIGLERFVVTMKELGLPRPKHMDKVLPANIQCGLQDLPGTWQTKVDSLPRPLPSGPNKTSPRMMPKQPQA